MTWQPLGQQPSHQSTAHQPGHNLARSAQSPSPTQPANSIAPDDQLLARNLEAMARCSATTVGLIRSSPSRSAGDATFVRAADGAITGSVGLGTSCRWLGSQRRVLDEARRLAAKFDAAQTGAAVVLGFGLGHHVGLLGEALARTGVVLVFEPDVALLRAVLSRIDYVDVFTKTNVVILTEPEDAAAISTALHGAEAVVALGVKILEHAPSMPRLGEGAQKFVQTLTTTIRALRTQVVTTLMQTETTLRNGLMNLDYYASCPGIEDLKDIGKGKPAVVVSAGPSLARNMAELAKPGVRDRVVIIAVQTVLKQLLGAGIRPHFVTALDYHEISARFYEGLDASDVEGVCLVVEPKANPAILQAFPGQIRCPNDALLDSLLGEEFSHDQAQIDPGATVAHMGYYLARHLGCDPVILVGQDLGFTDGQYYAPGAAIHGVWAGELNEFNTLEMLEWQRIVRSRSYLQKTTDHLDRPVYTDEQMSAYLVQFERMFAADAMQNLTTIDATQGGVSKRHVQTMTLAQALEASCCEGELLPCLQDAMRANPEKTTNADRSESLSLVCKRVAKRLDKIRRDVARVETICAQSCTTLSEMRTHHEDQPRVNRLIARVDKFGKQAQAISPAYEIIQHLNQTGQLNRFKADRQIHLTKNLEPLEKQKRQIERDIVNVEWLGASANQLGSLLDAAANAMRRTHPKLSRDPQEQGSIEAAGDDDLQAEVLGSVRSTGRLSVKNQPLSVVIPVDPAVGTLGIARDLHEPIAAGLNPLQLVLGRLGRCEKVGQIILLTQDPERVRAIAGTLLPDDAIIEHVQPHPLGERRHAVARARALAAACWRGGLCNMTIYDELCNPAALAQTMDHFGLDAALLVGCDWALLDVGLTRAVIERYHEDPAHNRLCFTQAAPGLSPCVITRSLVEELAANECNAGAFASIGGLLGYIPRHPILDPITKAGCVRIEAPLRDLGMRAIADSSVNTEILRRTLAMSDPLTVCAAQVASMLHAHAQQLAYTAPAHLEIELCPGRRTGGMIAQRALENTHTLDRQPMQTAVAKTLIDELARARPDAVLTFGGIGDPLMHPCWREIITHALQANLAAVHVRTDLQCSQDEALELLALDAAIVSVDLLADSPKTYRQVAGIVSYDRARGNLIAMLKRRQETQSGRSGFMPRCWIVPRITRCDAVYSEIESFYDRWLTVAQACVIDPLPRAQTGERITPLPEPALVVRRTNLSKLIVLSDGRALVQSRKCSGNGLGNVTNEGLVKTWHRVLRQRERTIESMLVEQKPAAVSSQSAPAPTPAPTPAPAAA